MGNGVSSEWMIWSTENQENATAECVYHICCQQGVRQ